MCLQVEPQVTKLGDSPLRSTVIAERLRQRTDEALRDLVNGLPEPEYTIDELMISPEAWAHVVASGIPARLVFAHPLTLQRYPQTSLYYRGISLLSQKRVAGIAKPVGTWESGERKKPLVAGDCLAVARLYNTVISSIITGSTNWTLENGYRNILATMGIGLDGTWRNVIGQDAEDLIKNRVSEWLKHRSLLTNDQDDPALFYLSHDTTMRFGSEPDIRFEKNGQTIATIEIKGGKDPAGALERLGAMQKSFDATPPGCVNILVAGVVTDEMRRRLTQIGVVKVFLLDELAHDGEPWEAFTIEVFHHVVRVM